MQELVPEKNVLLVLLVKCPESPFMCKKVPNYNAISASGVNGQLPMPRLNSFAQFN